MSETRESKSTTALENAAREVAAELANKSGCYCDEPEEGESGVIECTPCQHNRLALILLQALPASRDDRPHGRGAQGEPRRPQAGQRRGDEAVTPAESADRMRLITVGRCDDRFRTVQSAIARQVSLGWSTSAPATLPPEVEPPANTRLLRSLRDLEHMRWTPYIHDKPNPKPKPAPLPCHVRLMDRWEPAEVLAFYWLDAEKMSGPALSVRIFATGSRLEIRNREYVRVPKGGDE